MGVMGRRLCGWTPSPGRRAPLVHKARRETPVTQDHREWRALLEQQELLEQQALKDSKGTRVTPETRVLRALLELLEQLGPLEQQVTRALREPPDRKALKEFLVECRATRW